ncbi:pyridoxal phosphate-dependent aminotransferase [Lacrimispora sp. 210928-DFI.3.58]|uniref:pyridoxal phosphate-dependent aminotransferase n=1 Tax=Lacrimispora sp. 210928-DFI.3.58 TaxID=2883214 RepID=UPI0015B52F6F|nr:aminotransferase class I/II-fold pyridoxal phosphate-dependent enzyme [Lacrimispora sp. 210928-DFI.3.58]MCB7319333.1 aminotransferase class I/II-fold pyridoxal phosphate-dependent enzyme [Lacrimispora sp. 210928-DFI.3.58]
MRYVTLADHALRPQQKDKIFEASSRAKAAIKELGEENVINSTLGECLDDEGRLMVLPLVEERIRSMSIEEMFSYAPIAGVQGFNKAVEVALFGDNNRGFVIEAVPTPGGCGALRHVVWNYLDMGEAVITTEFYWGPYKGICEEHGRKLETFSMFNSQGGFNLEALDEKMAEVAERQKQILLILNTPANNPTGYTMTPQEMAGVVELIRKYAKDEERKITLCLDVSYIDYDAEFEESRRIFDELTDMPENTMVTVIFSMSKSFTMCGLRCGAIVCLSPTEEAARCFKDAMTFSSRSTWSNVIRPAQKVLVDICLDEDLKREADSQREKFRQIITKRGHTFLEEAGRAGLACCPYKHGFFITVPYENADKLAQALQEEQVYVVPLVKGIRFSPCAVTEEKCRRAPGIIKRVMERLEGEA